MIPGVIVNLICFVVGFIYPSYSTFKAVKSKNANHIHQWAIYWIVYSVYCLLEKFLDIIFYFWMPFYNEFKIMLLFMMTSNQASGSMLLYRTFVEPHLLENEQLIDVWILKTKEEGLKLIHFLYQHATIFMNRIKTQALVQLQIALQGLIRDGLFTSLTNFTNQTIIKSGDTVDSNEEQFTIIEKADGEFEVQEVTQETTMEYDNDGEEIVYNLTQVKRGRGRPKKNK